MNDAVAINSLRRSLQDWRDYWLTEATFLLPREARLLMLDLAQVPVSWNPVKRVNGDPERDMAVAEVIERWLTLLQQRLVTRAYLELNGVLLAESAARALGFKPKAPALNTHSVADALRHAAAGAEWQQTVPVITWAPTGASHLLDQFWASSLDQTLRSTLEQVRAHQL